MRYGWGVRVLKRSGKGSRKKKQKMREKERVEMERGEGERESGNGVHVWLIGAVIATHMTF